MEFKKLTAITLAAFIFPFTTWAQENKITYVDLEKLGVDVQLKNITPPQRKILRANGIDAETPQSPTGPINRVVKILDQKDPFVLNVWCNADMNGGQTCDLMKVINLNVAGKTLSLPKNEDLPLSFSEQSGSSSRSKFGVNEKQELVSIIYAGNYVKTFKGKKTCTNLGIISVVEPAKSAIVFKEIKIPLGTDCYVANKKNGNDEADDTFFHKLFTKLASK